MVTTVEQIQMIAGIASAIGCSFVIFTCLRFGDLRKLKYIRRAMYVAINNGIGSIGMALGKQQSGSVGCAFQAFTANANYISAMFWSTVMTIEVYLLVVHKVEITNEADHIFIHCVCWCLPMLVTLLPLSSSPTPSNDDFQTSWCYISPESDSANSTQLAWFVISFFFWVCLCIVVSTGLVFLTIRRMLQMGLLAEQIRATAIKLLCYPIVISLCWLPTCVGQSYTIFRPTSGHEPSVHWFADVSMIFSILPGLILSILFYTLDDNVKKTWKKCLISRKEEGMKEDLMLSIRQSSMHGPPSLNSLHSPPPGNISSSCLGHNGYISNDDDGDNGSTFA